MCSGQHSSAQIMLRVQTDSAWRCGDHVRFEIELRTRSKSIPVQGKICTVYEHSTKQSW